MRDTGYAYTALCEGSASTFGGPSSRVRWCGFDASWDTNITTTSWEVAVSEPAFRLIVTPPALRECEPRRLNVLTVVAIVLLIEAAIVAALFV